MIAFFCRVCYTAARGGHMLELFSYVNMKKLTPAPAVAFQVYFIDYIEIPHMGFKPPKPTAKVLIDSF